MTDTHAVLDAWQQRCKDHGLLLTGPRRAILAALCDSAVPCDAVALLQMARAYYARTSLGTVYRFLRELEHAHLLQAQLPLHGRTRWYLRDADAADTYADDEVDIMLSHIKRFLRELQDVGLAAPIAAAQPHVQPVSNANSTWAALADMAERLGYRLCTSAPA